MAFATVVVLVDALVGEHGLAATLRARRTYEQGQAQLAGMRAENAALRETARRLATDPGAIEALARTELGLVRPGEVLFIITPARPAGGAPTGLEP